jgi:hypothetical protein
MPGLTRDSIHVEWAYKDRNFRYRVHGHQHSALMLPLSPSSSSLSLLFIFYLTFPPSFPIPHSCSPFMSFINTSTPLPIPTFPPSSPSPSPRLVDTAGLTRIRTDKALLAGTKERRKMRVERLIGRNVRVTQRSGSSTYSAVELPGIALLDPEADPSQFSHQVSVGLFIVEVTM